uniref:Uncharacterized protein n=1 Tax=Anopheles coluzzii TaxID=1518534 RepID=A0A8W7PHD9_ANOCL
MVHNLAVVYYSCSAFRGCRRLVLGISLHARVGRRYAAKLNEFILTTGDDDDDLCKFLASTCQTGQSGWSACLIEGSTYGSYAEDNSFQERISHLVPVPSISRTFGGTGTGSRIIAAIVLRIRYGLCRCRCILLIVATGRRALIHRHRISPRPDGSAGRAGSCSTARRLILGKQTTQPLVVDQIACIEQAAQPAGTGGPTCRRPNAQPLIDVGADLLLDRVRDCVLYTAQDAAEESTVAGGCGRFACRYDDVTPCTVKLATSIVRTATTSTTTTIVRASSCTTSVVGTSAAAVATSAIASVTVARVVVRRQRRVE